MDNQKLKILLIDDDEDYFIITKDTLFEIEGYDFDIKWASSYESAIEIFKSAAHDIYFIDYHLGSRSGIDLLREFIAAGCAAPLIMLTGQGDKEIDHEAIQLGASDYLVKDEISPTILERSIRHAIERKKSENVIKESKEYAENLIRSSLDMIVAVNMNFKITEFNLSAESIFEYKKEEVLNKPVEILFNDPEKSSFVNKATLEEDGFAGEVMFKKKNGETFPAYISASILNDMDNKVVGIMTISRNITNQKRLEEKLIHDATHDTLTGLPNRALFLNRLELSIERKKRNENYLFAVLFLDVDRFKLINDSFGHSIGDQLLISVSTRLKDCLRSCDTLARFGGDEFVMLIEDIRSQISIKIVTERLLKALELPFEIKYQKVFVSASIGIALSSREYNTAEDIIRDADTVMYRAKSMGRARYAIFDVQMHAKVVSLLKLEIDLRKAINDDEFIIYYQPVLSLKTGKIIGVEALLRWNHPQKGMVPPMDFIPHAEETNLIIPIGELVTKKVCDQYSIWKNEGFADLTTAVNFSTLQFQAYNFFKNLKKVIEETNMDAGKFIIEITERTLMQKDQLSVATLKNLNDMGIQIAIDDFGTGYSALSSLRLFPIHTIKIDRSLVKDIITDLGAATISSAIIKMAHSLGLNVVAEGIETEEQLSLLKEHDCDEMQGFLFSKPVPAEEITKMLKEKRTL